ncbi:nucleoside triphosphate pyrophosphohydrolase [bacterium]|nr:nucleoside triphosphate pyrophosphohydrolase [bacterium]MBU1073436.1 nucleoside triphosphate pyrophosphohydrolase [bacterium]MBU1677177.1 nucleoside triphosphate pyrophosphohydrolase [bacterium]
MSLPHTQALLRTIRTLRAPGGCPWDQKQTVADAARFLLDEAGELLDAALAGDAEHVAEELGDLLFMVAFCCEILGETEPFAFEDVARGGNEKLIRRHPHVFGDVSAANHAESQIHWNAMKAAEKRANGQEEPEPTALKDLPASSSPLRQAHTYQQDAAEVGFDWPEVDGIWEKLREEMDELAAAAALADRGAVEHEVGDILLAVVNLSRRLGVEADDALRKANRRFRERFRGVESRFHDHAAMREAGIDRLEEAWQQAKAEEARDT